MVPPSCLPGRKSQKNRMRCVDLKIMCSKKSTYIEHFWGGFFKDPRNIWDISMFSFESPVGRFFSVQFSEAFLIKSLHWNYQDFIEKSSWHGSKESCWNRWWRELAVSNSFSSTVKTMPFSFSTSPKSFNLQRLILWAFSPKKKTGSISRFPCSFLHAPCCSGMAL